MTDFNKQSRHDMIQQLQKSDCQLLGDFEKPKIKGRHFLAASVVLAGLVTGTMMIEKPVAPPPKQIVLDCAGCHRKLAFSKYFEKTHRNPQEMAEAVLKTKSPRLVAAIARVEQTPHTNRKGGYRKAHAGAWQVNARYWGGVPHDVTGQALQAEAILNELAADMPIKKALSVYGGDSTDRYQKRVLAALEEAP